MTTEEIAARIKKAHALRPPRWANDERMSEKIDSLPDYILACAHMRAELEEARSWLATALVTAERQWSDLVRPSESTVKAEDRILRTENPELATVIAESKHGIGQIDRLVRRFELDERSTSRIYTLITGNG